MKALGKTYVAGHNGMVGSAILRQMQNRNTPPPLTASHSQLDLTQQRDVLDYLHTTKPDTVVVAAARVGGIEANRSHPAEFLYQNLSIAANVIHGSYQAGVKRLLFLGSSCIYPRLAPQPIPESALMSGDLEPTNEGYAVAKIAGMKLCQMYRKQYGVLFHSAMPTNLYGPGDSYDPVNSHVLPALIRRFEEARIAGHDHVTLWGTGTPQREFLHVDDLADAVLFLLQQEAPPDWVNVGSGEEVTIRHAAEIIRDAVGAPCDLRFDITKPDGTPRKLVDCSLINSLGWHAHTSLEEGIRRTVEDFRREQRDGTLREGHRS
jgi:GDP-L-fucose synthase